MSEFESIGNVIKKLDIADDILPDESVKESVKECDHVYILISVNGNVNEFRCRECGDIKIV